MAVSCRDAIDAVGPWMAERVNEPLSWRRGVTWRTRESCEVAALYKPPPPEPNTHNHWRQLASLSEIKDSRRECYNGNTAEWDQRSSAQWNGSPVRLETFEVKRSTTVVSIEQSPPRTNYSLLDVNVNCLFGNNNFVALRTTQTVCLATKFTLYFTDTKHKVHNNKLDLNTEIANVIALYKGDLRAESCNYRTISLLSVELNYCKSVFIQLENNLGWNLY